MLASISKNSASNPDSVDILQSVYESQAQSVLQIMDKLSSAYKQRPYPDFRIHPLG